MCQRGRGDTQAKKLRSFLLIQNGESKRTNLCLIYFDVNAGDIESTYAACGQLFSGPQLTKYGYKMRCVGLALQPKKYGEIFYNF